MTSTSSQRWRPDARFALRGGAIAFGVGLLVAALTQLGAGELRPFDLLLSGLASVLVFSIVLGLVALVLPRARVLTGVRKAATLAGIFFVAGALAWLIVHAVLSGFGVLAMPAWNQIVTGIGLSGLLAIVFGSGFYLYEAMRQRMLESASRLREAEFAERELVLARSIQERLLPPTELSGPGYRLAARHLAARFVAGDFFDVFSLPGGALGLVVADVAGKGVGASLIVASVKAVLPLLAADRAVDETLGALNRRLCDELDRRQFVALSFVRYEPDSGDIAVSSAGFPDPYLLREKAPPQPLSVVSPRLPLGLRLDQGYGTSRATLAPGDGLLLFSDGLPEAPSLDGEPLGYDALREQMPPLASDPGAWLDELFARVRRMTAPEPADDWTALLLVRPTTL